jgi:hypothetical protein
MEDPGVVANTHLQAYLVLPTKDSRKKECSMLFWKIIPWEWIPTLPQATASCDSFVSYFTSIVEGCDKKFQKLACYHHTFSNSTSVRFSACVICTIPSSPTGVGARTPPTIFGAINASTCIDHSSQKITTSNLMPSEQSLQKHCNWVSKSKLLLHQALLSGTKVDGRRCR